MNRLKILSILFAVFVIASASAFSQSVNDGWQSPATLSLGTGWTNPDSCFASDDLRANYTGTTGEHMILTNVTAGVPAGATIDSFIVHIEGYGTSAVGPRREVAVHLTKDGSTTEGEEVPNQQLPQSTDGVVTTRGVLTPLFNGAFTADEVNSTNFGIMFHKEGNKADAVFIDHVEIQIWYTEASAGGRNRIWIVGGEG